MAFTLWAQGELAESQRRLEEAALETMIRVLGEEHPATLTAQTNLAKTRRAQGSYPTAQWLQEAVWRVRMRKLGEKHEHTLTAMTDLASILSVEGGLERARTVRGV